MNTIDDELELLQKQIEETTDHMIRNNLFLKKVELLRLQENTKESYYKKIIDQLETNIKKELSK